MLALGLSTVVARAVTRRAEALARLVDRLPRLMLGACGVLVFLLVINLPAVAERLAARSRGAVSGDRPNVLLVVLDTVRASQLSLYGYHRPTTPHLDEWAKTGVVFERAFSTAPWTLPAHATMFTGGYHFETRTGPNQPLDRSRPTLAEILTEHGYATAGFVANLGYTTPMSGLHRGFARYEAHRLSLSSVFGSSWLGSGLLDLVGIEDDQGWKTAENVTAELLGWLGRRENDRPFFAFLNYFDAHAPYDSPEPYHSMFGPAAAGGALSNLNYQWSRFGYQWAQTPDNPSTRQQLALWMNQYDGAVAYIDHQLGVVHDALAARGLLDNTLVVVTADHGEHWGEHALAEHGNALYVPSLQVPLLISLPGVVQANQRVVRPVTLRDLPATMLALVGLRDEAALPGTPLLSLSGGSGPGPGSTILAELDRKPWHLAGPGRVPVERGDMKALFDGDLHYILNGDGIEELYDVVLDPEELDDLSENPEYGAALSRFRSTLRTMGTARQDQF